MAKTIRVTIGETVYEVPRLNIGQIEDMSELYADLQQKTEEAAARNEPLGRMVTMRHGRDLAQVILRRASPPIADVRDLECDPADLQTATRAVLRFSNLLPDEAEPGEAPATGVN